MNEDWLYKLFLVLVVFQVNWFYYLLCMCLICYAKYLRAKTRAVEEGRFEGGLSFGAGGNHVTICGRECRAKEVDDGK